MGLLALVLALLAWLAAAVGIWLISASHAWTTGCRVDEPLHNAGTWVCLPIAALLSLAAVVTGWMSRRGAHRLIAVVAIVMGAVGVVVSLSLLSTAVSPHAVDPADLHSCENGRTR